MDRLSRLRQRRERKMRANATYPRQGCQFGEAGRKHDCLGSYQMRQPFLSHVDACVDPLPNPGVV